MSKAGPGHAAAELSEQGVSVLAPSCVLCYKGYLCTNQWWLVPILRLVSGCQSCTSPHTFPPPPPHCHITSPPRAPSLSTLSTPRQDKVPASYVGCQLKHCQLCMMRAAASVMGRGDTDIDNCTRIQHQYYEGY